MMPTKLIQVNNSLGVPGLEAGLILSIRAGRISPNILMIIYLQNCRGRQKKKKTVEDKSCTKRNKIKSSPAAVEALRHGIIITIM